MSINEKGNSMRKINLFLIVFFICFGGLAGYSQCFPEVGEWIKADESMDKSKKNQTELWDLVSIEKKSKAVLMRNLAKKTCRYLEFEKNEVLFNAQELKYLKSVHMGTLIRVNSFVAHGFVSQIARIFYVPNNQSLKAKEVFKEEYFYSSTTGEEFKNTIKVEGNIIYFRKNNKKWKYTWNQLNKAYDKTTI